MPATIRLKIDSELKKTTFEAQGGSPSVWNNTPLNVEFGIFANDEIRSVTDFSSITVQLKPKTRRGAAIETIVVASADLNNTLTAEEWEAGVLYHGVAEFSAQDMAVDLQAKESDTFWMAVFGTDLTSGEPVMLGGTKIIIEESGINLEGDNVTQGANIVPLGAVYDGAGEYVMAVTEDVSYAYAQGANDDTLENGAQTLSADGLFTANGASVTLTGTIGEAVTATIRTPIYPTFDQVLSLVVGNAIQTTNAAGISITLVSPSGLKKATIVVNDNGNLDTIPADV